MIKHFIALLLLLLLTACGTPPVEKAISPYIEPRTITENDVRQATRTYLQNGGGPVASTYHVALADLNGDHIPEGLVMLNTPFNTWCGQSGCSLLIFEQKNDGTIRLNNRIEQVREPIYIHETSQKWHSIVFRHDGVNRDAIYIELQNNGTGYPSTSVRAPPYRGSSPRSGLGLFY